MRVGDLYEILRKAAPLSPEDSVAKAIRLLRARDLPMLPVAEGPHVIGMVDEAGLVAAVAGGADARGAAREMRVGQAMRPIRLTALAEQPLEEVAGLLREGQGEAVVVLGYGGRYLGLLLPRDALAALAGEPIVPPVAGLATPLGVYLTTGALRAGAGNLGLVATGAALMVLNLLAGGGLYGLAWSLDRLLGQAAEGPAPAVTGEAAMTVALVLSAVHMLIFLVLLRLSPLAGVHAAEHMVVHAIEEGEDLSLEKVRAMPRVHPRCGTNLIALLILLVIAKQFLTSVSGASQEAQVMALFVLALIVLLTWRRLGAGLQRWVTTRRPSDRQLMQGMRVGERLLSQIRERPAARASVWVRVWNAGLLQVVAGFFLVTVIADYGWPPLVSLWHLLAK